MNTNPSVRQNTEDEKMWIEMESPEKYVDF